MNRRATIHKMTVGQLESGDQFVFDPENVEPLSFHSWSIHGAYRELQVTTPGRRSIFYAISMRLVESQEVWICNAEYDDPRVVAKVTESQREALSALRIEGHDTQIEVSPDTSRNLYDTALHDWLSLGDTHEAFREFAADRFKSETRKDAES